MNNRLVIDSIRMSLSKTINDYSDRGIKKPELLKLLLRHHLNLYGITLLLSYELFADVFSIDKENNCYKIIEGVEDDTIDELYNNIMDIITSELNIRDMICHVSFKEIFYTIIYEHDILEQIKLNFYVDINSVNNIINNSKYILKNKNNEYFSDFEYNIYWIKNRQKCKIFYDLEEVSEIIFYNNFYDIEVIEIDNIVAKVNKSTLKKVNGIDVSKNEILSFINVNVVSKYKLYQWQQRAYDSWINNNYIGIIEAVTGSGKTLIAKYAIHLHLEHDYYILIIVPTIELQEQWLKVLHEFENYGIYKIGGNNPNQQIKNWKIYIAVVNSAIRNIVPPFNGKGLIIADECHHYGAKEFCKALNPFYTRRMGLTATYERLDDGIEKYLNPYFKNICYSLNYEEALNENIIAQFNIIFYGVYMTEYETKLYNEYDLKYNTARDILISGGLSFFTFGDFMRKATMLSKGNSELKKIFQMNNKVKFADMVKYARTFVKYFSERRSLVAKIEGKYDSLLNNDIQKLIKNSKGTIIFSQTVESGNKAIEILNKSNIKSNSVQSGMKKIRIKEILTQFETGELEVISAPRILDEGIDVPDADLAIILASNRNKRQMIQRMGRIIRKKKDNRKANLVVIYTYGTYEDPELGANEDFLDDIKNVASKIEYLHNQ